MTREAAITAIRPNLLPTTFMEAAYLSNLMSSTALDSTRKSNNFMTKLSHLFSLKGRVGRTNVAAIIVIEMQPTIRYSTAF